MVIALCCTDGDESLASDSDNDEADDTVNATPSDAVNSQSQAIKSGNVSEEGNAGQQEEQQQQKEGRDAGPTAVPMHVNDQL